jgi:hypothetical protein
VTDTSAAQDTRRSTAPLFYSSIAPLSPELHKSFKLRPEAQFEFARTSNTVPLTVPEFALAARHYPILLLGDDLVPTAALGLEPGQNLFVSPEGAWEQTTYVPAYVRRHPFILLGTDDERLTLGIDTDASSDKEGARPLFDASGKETDAINNAMDFCNQFHGAFMFTRDFSNALKAADIVTDCTLEIEPTPGQRMQLGSFKRVDEDKFKDLPEAAFLDWRQKNYLHAVYFMLQSMNNWDMLLIRNGMVQKR